MARATRTINPLHFEDLEPHRFEDLVRQLAYGFRPWRTLEATGRQGKDEGVDIRGWARVGQLDNADNADAVDDATSDREWRIQVKRHKSLGPADLRKIVTDAVPSEGPSPYGLIIAAACDVSADALAVFRETALARGVLESHMWSNAHLEDALFRPENDHLLFAYFGISITTTRRAHLAELRAALALKRKILATVTDKDDDKVRGLRQPFIVRDIDSPYPDFEKNRDQMRAYAPPWHAVTLREIHALGPVVQRFHYEGIVKPDGRWDIREDTRWWSTNSWQYSLIFEDGDDPDPTPVLCDWQRGTGKGNGHGVADPPTYALKKRRALYGPSSPSYRQIKWGSDSIGVSSWVHLDDVLPPNKTRTWSRRREIVCSPPIRPPIRRRRPNVQRGGWANLPRHDNNPARPG